jgi:hypothetical protein
LCPDRTLGYDATVARIARERRRLLDDEASPGDPDLERRVVEITAVSTIEARRHGLEDAPVQAYRVSARAER